MASTDEKTLTCSMTRANKILASLREPKAFKKNLYDRTSSSVTHGISINIMNYASADTQRKLNDITSNIRDVMVKRRLLEKFKNRLFTLNVRYNIHDILSEIEVLKAERDMLTNIIKDYDNNNYMTMASAAINIEAIKSSDKKYEFKWNVSAFDLTSLKNQVKTITKRLSVLDEKRDSFNIQNSFTLSLTDDEYIMLDLE